MVEIAVVGVGGWGKNLARNYYQIVESNLRYICDLDDKKLETMGQQYPGTRLTKSFDDLLEDDELDAIVIATTAPGHYPLAKRALEAGKSVAVRAGG